MLRKPRYIKPPTEFYQSTRQWLEKTGLQSRSNSYTKFDFDQAIEVCHWPQTTERSIHRRFKEEIEKKPTPTFIAVIPKGRVWGRDGIIITPDNKILWDLSIVWKIPGEVHPIFKKKRLPPIRKTEDTVAVLAFRFSHIYYHWLFDVLPRLHLLRSSNISYDKILVNYNAAKPFAFQKETLSLLDLPKEQIINCYKHFHLEAEQLVVPSVPGYNCSMPKWTCDFLRKEFLIKHPKGKSTGNERLYISRENARFRKVLNEDKVLNILSGYGFKKISLEGMPFKEQVKMFSEAEIIVSAHGSGLANLVFCNQGTKVLELFSPNYIHVAYWVLSNHVKLDYYYLIGVGKRSAELANSHLVWENIKVNLYQLKQLLKKMNA